MIQSVDNSVAGILLSGLRGGSGKTILSLALITLCRKKGLSVVPFKKGPDYIDAGWLAKAGGHECYNLDLFMIPPERVVHSFLSRVKASDIAIIEGNRGLYDGMDYQGTYSTAELSKLLSVPVLIVVDCTKSTTTISAMIMGCQGFDPDVSIAGVLLNNVANSRQEGVIREAIVERCGIPVLGAIPRLKSNPLPERHMGLTPFHEHKEVEEAIERIGGLAEKYIDIDSILRIADQRPETRDYRLQTLDSKHQTSDIRQQTVEDKQQTEETKDLKSAIQNPRSQIRDPKSPRIGVIRDSAFQFYYPENLEALEKAGARIIDVSAIEKGQLPDIDTLYIGGGFPETHAIQLSENKEFMKSLKDSIEKGLPVYAECGGLMYLGKALIMDDKTYPMVGALPLTFKLEKRPQAHGYTIVEVRRDNPYFKEGTVLRGHEFHYSYVVDAPWKYCYFAFTLKRGRGIKDGMDGICYKSVLGTYTHLHALGGPEWVDGMIKVAKRFKAENKR
jgi:cobyrinic acid a,c-diamide synthase